MTPADATDRPAPNEPATDRAATDRAATDRPGRDRLDLGGLALVDQHCHAVRLDELTRPTFEVLCTESPYPAGHGSHLDGPVGLAIRRWCPPALDLDPFCGWDDYLARRGELGAPEVARRLLRAAGHQRLIVDTGYRGAELCSLDELGELAGLDRPAVSEIVRIEVVAEELATEFIAESAQVGGDPATRAGDFLDAFATRLATRLATRAGGAVGLKSVLAYRCGFDLDLLTDDRAAVAAAVGRWLQGGAGRLDDPVVEAAVVRVGARLAGERGLPLQFHVGYGDPDVVLHRSNPSLLTPFLEWCAPFGTRVVLLHCWPFEREAGFLATVYPHVWLDVGLSMNYLGPSAPVFLARALECTPFPKVLYSSDAFGLPELYLAGAAQFRDALGRVLGGWIADGALPAAEALKFATAIGGGNAEALYQRGAHRG